MLARLLAVLAALLVTAPVAHASKKPRIAVLELRAVEPSAKPAAELIAEVILTDLAKTGRFEVIGASDIAEMLGFEKQKQLLGCSDESNCLAEIGGALGAQWLLTGSIGRFGSSRRIDLRLIDARRSRVVARDGASIQGEDALLEWVHDVLPKLTAHIPQPAGKPAPVAEVEASGAGPRILPPVLVGVGAAAAGAGAWLGYSALAFNDEKANLTFDEARSARSSAETKLIVGGTLLAAGATTALAGVALWIFGGEAAAPVAAVTPDSVVLALSGSF